LKLQPKLDAKLSKADADQLRNERSVLSGQSNPHSHVDKARTSAAASPNLPDVNAVQAALRSALVCVCAATKLIRLTSIC
jgi:hypothetical protein